MYKKENIKKDFWKLFFPLLIIFYIFIAYNIVDVYFASFLGEKVVAGLQIAFPMFFLILAFNEAISTATNNLTSISLGEQNEENIAKYFTIGTILSLVFGGIFFIFSEQITNLFISLSKITDKEIIENSFNYGNILLKYGFIFIFSGIVWQYYIIFKKRNIQIFNAVFILILNIFLDYFFIKYLNYNTDGIAYATVITWIFTSIFGIYYIVFKEKITYFTIKFGLKEIKNFLSYASSTFFVMLLVMGTIMVDNYFFGKIGPEAIASYGIGTRLKDVVFYPIISFSIVFSILYGFFYGQKDKESMKKILNYSIKIGFFYSLGLLIIMPLIAKIFGGFFTNNELTLKYLLYYMIFSSISMVGFTFEFIYSSILQIVSYHKTRIILNIVLLILVFILEYIFYNIFKSYIGIWIGAVLASLTISFLTYLIYKIKVEKYIFK